MNYLRTLIFGLVAILSLPLLASTTPVIALTGDAAHGKVISETCATCHGPEGKAIMPAYPNLAGQHASYLVHSLVEFKKGPQGQRNNPIMFGMSAPLSDQDMADLAAYYESLPPITGGLADSAQVELGQKIYRSVCIGCHGPKGEGYGLAKYPRLADQNADYIVAQLTTFKTGERKSPNGMMNDVTKNMTPQEMAAVASYIQGLK